MLVIYSINNSYAMTAQQKLDQTLAGLAKTADPASKAAIVADALREAYSAISQRIERVEIRVDEMALKWAKWEYIFAEKFPEPTLKPV